MIDTNGFDPASFGNEVPPSNVSRPLQALWWLKKGALKTGSQWREAHHLCQMDEGDAAHDIVHALVHWIEGDMPNADYWYRRAGSIRSGSLESEWARVETFLFAGMQKHQGSRPHD